MNQNWGEKIKAFNKRWNIVSTINSAFLFSQFQTRIINTFQDIDNHVYRQGVKTFCKIFSISYQEGYRCEYVVNALRSTTNFTDLYKMLEIIFALDIYDNNRYAIEYQNKEWYLKETQEIFEISGVEARIIRTKQSEILIVPAGEEKLDEELVNLALSFLDESSNNHFVSALKFYEQKDWIRCAEGLRRSLEEYLRKKLKNAGLQKNIAEIGKKLKDQKSPVQIRSIIVTIFGHLDQFFNENCKHKDGDLEESDAEFLIYQTALLMRYVEKYV